MSRQGVAAFLTRVMEDEGFRNQLKASPDATLAQFDLTPDEVAAIKSADPSKIQELGVDERVSKAALAGFRPPVEMGSWPTQVAQLLKQYLVK